MIFEFLQVVSAAGNNAARAMLSRDLRDRPRRFALELKSPHCGEDMWAL